jgi:NADPH2:quinone reductase
MKAAVIGANGLEIWDMPVPEPKSNEIQVRVRAAALNRADLLMVAGGHGFTAAAVAGLEWSGEVVKTGGDVTGFRAGDRVMCSGNGGYAEYAVCDAGRASAIPANNMTFEQAATLPIALNTMHNAVVTAGRLAAGESVLIQGASSGVGLMGLQIAKEKGAKLVIGTSTNADRRAKLRDYGADLALDSSDPKWADAVLEATDGKGVDLIVDQVSGGVMNDNLKAVRILGRIVNVGRLGGFSGEFNFDLHAFKRVDYIGVTFRTRSPQEVREIVTTMQADLWDAVEAGRLHIPIDRTFPLDDAAAAQDHMRRNGHFGKILLTP